MGLSPIHDSKEPHESYDNRTGNSFALTSTFRAAQADGTAGYGSVVAPSVGSYPATVVDKM